MIPFFTKDNENIDEVLNKLLNLLKIYKELGNTDPDSKQCINDIKKYYKIIEKHEELLYVKISERNGVIVWGHPSDPHNIDKQIKYIISSDGKYNIKAGKNAKAYIINSDRDNIEYIDIDSGKLECYGQENKFSHREIRASERYEVSKKRLAEFNEGNLQVTLPFFIDEKIKDFESIKKDLLGLDLKKAYEAFRKLQNLKHAKNTFIHTPLAVPYINQEGKYIFGFDDSRGDERYCNVAGSTYSLAYKIAKKLEIIISTKTTNCFVAVCKNPGMPNQHIELLSIGERVSDKQAETKIECSGNKPPEIIDTKLGFAPCPNLCAVIRETGESRELGIDIFEKVKKLISDIDLSSFTEPESAIIRDALDQTFLIKYHNFLILSLPPKPLDPVILKKSIEDSLKTIKDFNQDSLIKLFIELADNWAITKEYEPVKKNNGRKFTDHIAPKDCQIYLTNNYKVSQEFDDNNCQDEGFDSFKGKVYLCIPKYKNFNFEKDVINSFIIEVMPEPFEIRIRLGGKEGENLVNTQIKIGQFEAKIESGKILYKNELGVFQENLTGPFRNPSSPGYHCKNCLAYQNTELLIERQSSNSCSVM